MGYAGEAKSANGCFEGFEVFIKYLPPSTTEQQLAQHFEHCGTIVGAPRLLKAHDGACKGVGWITFETHDAHAKAIRANGTPFRGRNLQVTPAKAAHTGFRPSVQAAGTHTPAMLHECIEQLVKPDRDGVVVDATFGRGGHSRGMLAALSERGTLHGFDMDHDAMASAEELKAADKRFCIHHAPFSRMREHLGDGSVSGVLFDLGISSPQFDEAHRGFRPEADGPLDLRFDQSRGETAFEYLLRVPREELIRVLVEGGETSDAAAARRIADAIILARENGKLPRRTQRFAALVAAAKGVEYQAMHPAKLTFQALRIHLNDEFGELCRGVRASFHLLREGGRIGVITWKHSECALLIDVFRTLEAVRDDMPQMAYLRETEPHAKLEKGWALEMTRTIRPSSNELATNSRSRSAVLHIMTKVRKATVVQLERRLYATLGWEVPPAAEGEEVVSPQVDEARDSRPKKKTKKKKRKQGAGEAAPTAESGMKELMSKKQKQKPSS